MIEKGTKLFPEYVRTIEFSTHNLRTTITAKILFRNETARAAVPDWVRQEVISPEGIALKKNLFVDSNLVYNAYKQECLRILDWFPDVVDRGDHIAQEALIPWKDVKAFKVQAETEPVR
jgi:hypothetical protein